MKRFACTLALVVLIATGCATGPIDQSGFLGHTLDFQPASDGSGAFVYRKPGLTSEQARSYTRFIVDPVMVWYSTQSDYKGIFPDELKGMTDFFRAAAISQLKARYAVVEDPGPGTLRVRAAIVDMHRENPVHLYQFTPVGLALTGAKQVAGLDEVTRERVLAGNSYIISAAIEVGFYDSVTNELVVAFRDAARVSPQRLEAGGATWAQVQAQLELWAKKFRARVDAVQETR